MYYNRVHVHVTGNCMEWRQDRSSQGGGYLSTDVFVDIAEETWHANLNVVDAFAPVMILLLWFLFYHSFIIEISLLNNKWCWKFSFCVEKEFSCAAVWKNFRNTYCLAQRKSYRWGTLLSMISYMSFFHCLHCYMFLFFKTSGDVTTHMLWMSGWT